jgi:hypothetical protein
VLLFLVACQGASEKPLATKALPESVAGFMLGADSFVLESIDPWKDRNNYPVLGKVAIDDPKERRALVEALDTALAAPAEPANKCFDPRHRLTVTRGEKKLVLVICFLCGGIDAHGEQAADVPSSLPMDRERKAERVFNAPFKRAGIPLAAERQGEPPALIP